MSVWVMSEDSVTHGLSRHGVHVETSKAKEKVMNRKLRCAALETGNVE